MAIRAVLFDYAGVMTEDMRPVVAGLAAASGAPTHELADLLLGDYDVDGSAHPWHRMERGELTMVDLVAWGREQGAARGWNLDLGALMTAFMSLPIRPEMVERARTLRQNGYRTALLTNNARELAELWRAKMPTDEIFDVVIDSSDVGLRKPDPAIYLLTLERLGVDRDEAVMLDDMDGNVAAARALGMRGIRVESDATSALTELDRLLDEEGQPGETSPSRVTR